MHQCTLVINITQLTYYYFDISFKLKIYDIQFEKIGKNSLNTLIFVKMNFKEAKQFWNNPKTETSMANEFTMTNSHWWIGPNLTAFASDMMCLVAV